MAERLHPIRLSELEAWRDRVGVTVEEARKRFVQFVALESIAAAPDLREALSFKGGNALRFVYGSPRGTSDLDFTAGDSLPDEQASIREALDRALLGGGRTFGVKLKCQRVDRKPPKKVATLPTYDVGVGYQFPGDRFFADFESAKRAVPTVVKIEISFNDLVCETLQSQLSPDLAALLRVCSLEDILAEKLRALLQQVIRNRTRPQDVFDVARMLRERGPSLDYGKIATFLTAKCAARNISVARSAFNDEVRDRASFDYEKALAVSAGDRIPFNEAWQAVLAFVAQLAIPP